MRKGSSGRRVILPLAIAALLLASCATMPPKKWSDGEYTGAAQGLHGEIGVLVVVRNGRIQSVAITNQEETIGVADLALESIPARIVKKQSTQVDFVAGATVSSKGIMAAVENALEKAKSK